MNTVGDSRPVLVTGAAGFLGAWVAQALAKRGHYVVGLDDLSGGYRANVEHWLREDVGSFVSGSILDVSLIRKLFDAHDFQHVFHLAAYAAEGLSPYIRRFNYENNVLGSMVLINEAIGGRNVEKFVFTSSIAVYGEQSPPFDEKTVPQPMDPYGVAKLAVELDLAAAHETHGLDYIVFRPHNVFGELQNLADPFRNVVGIFLRQAMRGEPLTVFGTGDQRRAFTYVDAVADTIAGSVAVPAATGQVFNIGGDEVISVADLARLVCHELGVELQVRHLPARHEAVAAFSDHSRAATILGYEPRTSIEEGLGRMGAWARTVGPVSPKVSVDVEVAKGLPPSWASLVSATTHTGKGGTEGVSG